MPSCLPDTGPNDKRADSTGPCFTSEGNLDFAFFTVVSAPLLPPRTPPAFSRASCEALSSAVASLRVDVGAVELVLVLPMSAPEEPRAGRFSIFVVRGGRPGSMEGCLSLSM